jgi:hypothetical protein
MNLLLADTTPTRIARERDRSNFHLDQLPNATSVIFEEPIIDQTTVGTWKLLLEGAPIPTDMKHADKELIDRIPVFITTNQPLWNWVSSEDAAPLKQRIFVFNLSTTITRLAASKQTTHSAHMERFNVEKLNKVEGKEHYHVEISNRFAALENLIAEVDINRAWETLRI